MNAEQVLQEAIKLGDGKAEKFIRTELNTGRVNINDLENAISEYKDTMEKSVPLRCLRGSPNLLTFWRAAQARKNGEKRPLI